MARYLTIVRGIPGSGKTTTAKQIVDSYEDDDIAMHAADDYFTDSEGNYCYNPRLIRAAHKQCKNRTLRDFNAGKHVIVHNTFIAEWEIEQYFTLLGLDSNKFSTPVYIVDLFDGNCTDTELMMRNTHGVPLDVIQRMRRSYYFIGLNSKYDKFTSF